MSGLKHKKVMMAMIIYLHSPLSSAILQYGKAHSDHLEPKLVDSVPR
jgi:hypothetical protein